MLTGLFNELRNPNGKRARDLKSMFAEHAHNRETITLDPLQSQFLRTAGREVLRVVDRKMRSRAKELSGISKKLNNSPAAKRWKKLAV